MPRQAWGGIEPLGKIFLLTFPFIGLADLWVLNRQLTHRTVRTQDFPDFWVLGGLRATRTLPVVFSIRIGPEGLADGLLTNCRHPCSHLSSEGTGVPGALGRACKSTVSGCSRRNSVPLGIGSCARQNQTSICSLGLRRAFTED